MIRARGVVGGRPMMLLGLSGENVTRLTADEPIMFPGDELGFRGYVAIVYGRTEDELLTWLRQRGLLAGVTVVAGGGS